MYVAELDRSWLHTPFSGPGLMLTHTDQIATLQRQCRYVYVDPALSEAGVRLDIDKTGAETFDSNLERDDFSVARAALKTVLRGIADVTVSARRVGEVDLGPLKKCADVLVKAATQYPDTCLWQIQIVNRDGLLYRRALGTAVAGIIFGRQMGYDEDSLQQLALGGLILDIGKTTVPVPILAMPRKLNSMERDLVNRHVQKGYSLLRLHDHLPERVAEMILGHHERIDGSGYPRGLKGTAIPLFARIAAIIDTYDALTVNRRYASALSSHGALRYLNAQGDRDFDAALVDEFIHAVGIYPTGTRVKLADGNVGLVCAQNPDRPSQPQVLVTHDGQGRELSTLAIRRYGLDTQIVRALEPKRNGEDTESYELAIRRDQH